MQNNLDKHLVHTTNNTAILTFGLELQEFEDLGLLGMMAFVLEMANDSGHYSSGEAAKLMAKAQPLSKKVEGYSRAMNNLVVLLHVTVKAIGKI